MNPHNNTPALLGGTPTMSSREIADLCETRHNQVVETIERLFAKGVLRESRKTTRTHRPEGGGRPTEVYDLTKRDTLVVASGYNDELRAKIIDRWAELEQRAATFDPQQFLSDPTALRGLLLQNVEKVIALQGQVAAMETTVKAYDQIATADGSLCITDAAKHLGTAPKELFRYLRENQWIYRRVGTAHDVAYQAKILTGLMEHKVTVVHTDDGREKVRTQARVTPKGLARLASAFVGETL